MYLSPAQSAPSTQTVSSYLISNVPTAGPGETAGAFFAGLLGRKFNTADHVFVINGEGHFRGTVPLSTLLAADPASSIDSLAVADWPVVPPGLDREDAASIAIQKGVSTLAVTDLAGRFLGAVPSSALLSILRDEHLEDLHHMAGILGRSEAARRAMHEPPPRRALYRLPWLLVGLAGSSIATAIMAGYQAAFEANIAITFFIPAIVYLADAIGTQSEAIAVRGLSLSPSGISEFVAGELGTGALMGLVLGSLAFALVWIAFRNTPLAAAVALALLAAGTVASSVGSFLPWLFSRLGWDPAHGSGPVGTVIQDVLSLLIYFALTSALVPRS